jgi:hypothetical protein
MGLLYSFWHPSDPQSRRIDGTFLQLLKPHTQWSDQEWRNLFATFRRLHIVEIIVQWSALQDASFHEGESSPVATILRLADENQMRVTVGLAFDPAYWRHVDTALTDRQTYLDTALSRSLALAETVAPLLHRHPSFRGWYISEEIDDKNWVKDEARALMTDYIRKLSDRLHGLLPRSSVSLSGFADGQTSAAKVETLWSELFAAGIDIALFQDGVGARKLTVAQLPGYFDAVAHAARKHRREFWPVVELYTEIPSAAGRPDEFHAVAADLTRVCAQISVAAAYGGKIVGFAVPNYLSPTTDATGRDLFNRYSQKGC